MGLCSVSKSKVARSLELILLAAGYKCPSGKTEVERMCDGGVIPDKKRKEVKWKKGPVEKAGSRIANATGFGHLSTGPSKKGEGHLN